LRLIHEASGIRAHVGDFVGNKRNNEVRFISYFREPHKPASEGKVSTQVTYGDSSSRENYVSVWGLKWIEREDRGQGVSKEAAYREALESALKWCQEDVANEDAYPTQDMMEARVHELEEILAP